MNEEEPIKMLFTTHIQNQPASCEHLPYVHTPTANKDFDRNMTRNNIDKNNGETVTLKSSNEQQQGTTINQLSQLFFEF